MPRTSSQELDEILQRYSDRLCRDREAEAQRALAAGINTSYTGNPQQRATFAQAEAQYQRTLEAQADNLASVVQPGLIFGSGGGGPSRTATQDTDDIVRRERSRLLMEQMREQAAALQRQVRDYEQRHGTELNPPSFARSASYQSYIWDDELNPMNKFTLKPKAKVDTVALSPTRFVGQGQILRALRALPKTKGTTVITDRHDKWIRIERMFRSWVQAEGYKYGLRKGTSSRRAQFLRLLNKWFKTTEIVWTTTKDYMEETLYTVNLKSNCTEVWNNNLRNNPVWVLTEEVKSNPDYYPWDELQKIYYYHTSGSTYVTYKNGRKVSHKFALVGNYKNHICKCGGCKVYVLIKDCKDDLVTEQPRCERCRELPPHVNKNDLDLSTKETIIKGYHSHGTAWQVQIARVNEKDLDIPFGIELEIHSKLGNNFEKANESAWHIAKAQRAHNPLWNYFYFERDGSLMDGGFEMITQPMTLGFHREFWGVMLPKIREVAVGWNTYQLMKEWGLYGIHITFARKHWGDYHLARLLKFLDNPDNAWFVRGIAQRDRQYKTEDASLLAQKKRPLADRIHMKDKKISSGKARNQPVNIKSSNNGVDGLCEVRIFRSTLNTESFFKNIEFLHAFRMWCMESPFRIGALDFISWLSRSSRAQIAYPNLIGYLSRPKFPCRGTKGIKNPIAVHFKHVKGIAAPIDVSKVSVEDRLKDDLESCAS